VSACLVDDYVTRQASTFNEPSIPGTGLYYLVRAGGPVPECARTWGTGVPQELPGAGGNRDADLALDPDTCP
jgi:hypothetical protein